FSIHRGVPINFKPEIAAEHGDAMQLYMRNEPGQFSYRIENYEACTGEFEHGESRVEIRRILEEERDTFEPDLVISHSKLDSNQDHSALASEVRRVFKRTTTIYDFVFPWNHQGLWPNIFVQLSLSDMGAKNDALKCYKSQYRMGTHYYMRTEIQMAWAEAWGSLYGWHGAEAFIFQTGLFNRGLF
ncbi:MAG TPA: hypothetical protein VMW91_08305, partial [Desulfosporosinus sp.]|nr:hypothetical protein [Desulfosporosinus sp.]